VNVHGSEAVWQDKKMSTITSEAAKLRSQDSLEAKLSPSLQLNYGFAAESHSAATPQKEKEPGSTPGSPN